MKTKPLPFDPERKWFDVKNVTAATADLFIYDEIGFFGITAGDAIAALKGLNVSTLNVHINSPGGSVFDGFAIYNALNAHPAAVVVHIDGIAASIASVIAMAGDQIIMAENAMVMVHCPTCSVVGYAKDLRAQADVLDQIEGSIVAAYAARTGIPAAEIKAMMEAETWMTSAQCLANGFCDEAIAAKQIAARWQLPAAFKNAPAALPTLASPEEDQAPPLRLHQMRQTLLEKVIHTQPTASK